MLNLSKSKCARLSLPTSNRPLQVIVTGQNGEVGEREIPAVASSNGGAAC